jgi:hypothetical protein
MLPLSETLYGNGRGDTQVSRYSNKMTEYDGENFSQDG